jgi:predicted NAD/FAD-binding protein
MFKHLGVKIEASDMSFALSINEGELEWAGQGPSAVFAQKKNLVSPSFLMMLWDIFRFAGDAPRVLSNANRKEFDDMTLGEFLKKENYSQGFITNYILPITSAVWSTPMKGVLDFPVKTLFQFYHNHRALQIFDRPQWKTVTGGSWEYVRAIEKIFKENNGEVRLNCGVTKVQRKNNQVIIRDSQGIESVFDKVIFACHGDTALSILADPSAEEKNFLSQFAYTTNVAYLHQDEALMPKIRGTWASWNYLMQDFNFEKNPQTTLTYWMNRLQPFLPSDFPLFVTVNPYRRPEKIKYSE